MVILTADDDSRVMGEFMREEYECVACLNAILQIYSSIAIDETLVSNTLWVIGNIIGEKNSVYT
jgi:hypothetical protein